MVGALAPAAHAGWRMQQVPSDNQLGSVACTSTRFCAAVTADARSALHWNGRRWRARPSPVAAGAISCSSSRACLAVGRHGAARWGGTRWRPLRLPAGLASAVSCPAAQFCVAVGTHIGEWNGRRWRTVRTPGTLHAVSCPSRRACVAVGARKQGRNGREIPLVERWDGRRWHLEHPPGPPPGAAGSLHAVSCPTERACVVLGLFERRASIRTDPVALHYDGWRWVRRRLTAERNALLLAVACTRPSRCLAVGDHDSGHETLVERWDGRRWTVLRTPPVSADFASLDAVACVRGPVCEAVGGASTLVLDVGYRTRSLALRLA
jgi:hypothetical protein